MFEREQYATTTVDQLMQDAPAEVEVNSSMESVMRLFDESQAWNLPVVKEGVYLGFISKSTIFTAYRQQLKKGDTAHLEG
jgi:CIC family chloride channel protein